MFRRRPRPEATQWSGREVSRREITGLGAGGMGERRTSDDASARTPVELSVGLVQQILDEFGLRHGIDEDGDIVVRWEKCLAYFFFYGDEQAGQHHVLQARLYLSRRFDVDERTQLTVLLDEWNRTRLFGKAYTVLPDDGRVAVCAEQAHDFEGATRAQVKYAMALWIDVLLRFGDWIDEQI